MIVGIGEVKNLIFTNDWADDPIKEYPLSNLLDKSTLKKVKYLSPASDVKIKVDFDSQLVSLVGMYGAIGSGGVADLYNSGSLVETVLSEKSAETGNYIFKFTETTADRIDFTLSSTMSEIGYIWIGRQIELKIETFQITYNSDDDAEVSRGNTVQGNDSYEHDSLQLTTVYEKYLIQRARFEDIFRTSYADPRPFILDLTCSDADLHYYAIMDSGRVKFNSEFLNDQFAVNTTIGIREVN